MTSLIEKIWRRLLISISGRTPFTTPRKPSWKRANLADKSFTWLEELASKKMESMKIQQLCNSNIVEVKLLVCRTCCLEAIKCQVLDSYMLWILVTLQLLHLIAIIWNTSFFRMNRNFLNSGNIWATDSLLFIVERSARKSSKWPLRKWSNSARCARLKSTTMARQLTSHTVELC